MDRGLFESRAKACAAIESGGVRVDGEVARRASALFDLTCAIEATAAHPWVGRGGVKLAYALELWPVPVEGRIVLDVGASTGGFVEVCLSKGARKVYAVDVGSGQLHQRIKSDTRVVDLHGIDARALDRSLIPEAADLIVCDVSFISLTKVLCSALALATEAANLIALVKPQFEVGRKAVGRGGLVRDPALRLGAVEAVREWLTDQGWSVCAVVDSPISGGSGAREFLLHARRGADQRR